MPKPMPASSSSPCATRGSRVIATKTITVDQHSPVTTTVFRTRVGDPPRAIQRSENQPAQIVDAAMTKKQVDVIFAIWRVSNPRACMKYVGSHVSRKYQK